jgi:DNA-directed RNA polymerase II subunit RPB1
MPLGIGFSHSKAPVKTISDIQFGILSPEEIVRPASSLAQQAKSRAYHRLPSPPSHLFSRLHRASE